MHPFIKSPLNYTGNKFRILPQIIPEIPKDIDTMVDLFCGGATVGANIQCEKVIFIDNNERIIELLEYLANCRDSNNLIVNLHRLADKYNLTCSGLNGYAYYREMLKDKTTNNGLKEINSDGFYILREDYNKLSSKSSSKAFQMLYLLMVYSFNNDIRFSSVGNYNLPIGKTDLNNNNIKKLKEFVEKMENKKALFICEDFDSKKTKDYINEADFIYLDPPYLLGTAVYNESSKWNNETEYRLLGLLDEILESNKPFMLSNILKNSKGYNEPLAYWLNLHKDKVRYKHIDYHYKSASYNKKNRKLNEQEIIAMGGYSND